MKFFQKRGVAIVVLILASLYNANWDKMFGSIMAVVTVQSSDNLENTAYDYADTMQLGSNDAILVIAKQQQDYYLVASGDFYDLLSGLSQSFVASCMADNVQKGDYDAAVRSLCAERGGAGRGGQRCDVHHDPHHILCPLDHA